jgi:glycosyltransferase involved in cell wall biosynthesis
MKLIVQIPCFNEAGTLPQTFADIPRSIPGVDEVEVLIVDDGSTDDTVAVARRLGVDHIVRHKVNQGLAQAFYSGVEAALGLGADIIVNTDGDNQYSGRCIARLIGPILDGTADVVVGDRQTSRVADFSTGKKALQALGSFVVRRLSGTTVPDTVSGFRAMSREAALHINIVSPFSYTIEMLIQAGHKKMAVASIPIETNAATRRSRLSRSVPQFIAHSLATMMRIYTMYHPLRMFSYIGLALAVAGMVPIVRFLYFYFSGDGGGHVQSLVLGGVLLMMGFVTFVFALIADLINFNRRLIEMTLQKVRALELAADGRTRRLPGDATAALPKGLREAARPRGEEATAPVLGRGA